MVAAPDARQSAPARFVVFGAGAIGGVVGGRLFQHGHDVVLVARGAHADALRHRGLRLESPGDTAVLGIPTVSQPAEITWRRGDVVLLAVKSQDTARAVAALVAAGLRAETPIVCVQNGVDNERVALRSFPNVYGVCVMCPASYLEPGVVQASSAPVTGILDVGRYPTGVDGTAHAIAIAFGASTFSAAPTPDIMRWKYCKLILNLGNAVEAVCGPEARAGDITRMARREAVDCLRAAGIAFASKEEDQARRGDLVRSLPVGGRVREGGSSWQSLRRQTGTIETAYLNGEIVLVGRLCGLATPVNTLLTELALAAASGGRGPGSVSPDDFMAELARRTADAAAASPPG